MTPRSSSPSVMRAALAVLRLLVSACLLVAVARTLDMGGVLLQLGALDPTWVVLGLAVSTAQVVLLAWRWRFTAERLGIDLPMGIAVGEYYLSVLLNQVLPGGVTGDATRAWRHARGDVATGAAIRAVILERASAQAVMTTVAVVSVAVLPSLRLGTRLAVATAALAVGTVVVAVGARSDERLRSDLRATLLDPGAFALQLGSAAVAVASYLGVFLIAARAIGVDTPSLRLLPLVAPVLMTMLIPVTVAGWGIREGAAAALWASVGLTSEEGVAISVAYGILALVSTAPGLVVLTRLVLAGGRGRRERRHRDGSIDMPDAAPGRGSRSDPA